MLRTRMSKNVGPESKSNMRVTFTKKMDREMMDGG